MRNDLPLLHPELDTTHLRTHPHRQSTPTRRRPRRCTHPMTASSLRRSSVGPEVRNHLVVGLPTQRHQTSPCRPHHRMLLDIARQHCSHAHRPRMPGSRQLRLGRQSVSRSIRHRTNRYFVRPGARLLWLRSCGRWADEREQVRHRPQAGLQRAHAGLDPTIATVPGRTVELSPDPHRRVPGPIDPSQSGVVCDAPIDRSSLGCVSRSRSASVAPSRRGRRRCRRRRHPPRGAGSGLR